VSTTQKGSEALHLAVKLGLALVDLGRHCFVGRKELAPPRLRVLKLTPGDELGDILEVDLHPGPVGGEQGQRQAPFLDDQDGLAAVGA
jgi:hypothetical protein